MMEEFQNKYRIPSARLQGYDYGFNGFYFVTICTKNRKHYFGSIVQQPSIISQIAIEYWSEISKHYPFVELDEFVVMPNHIHGILFFNRPEKIDWQSNQFGAQSQNLAAVIRGFKSSTKRYANQNNIEFEWQPRFHDRIIRNDKELNAIRQYIVNNPMKWANDCLNLPRHTIEHETENLLKNIDG